MRKGSIPQLYSCSKSNSQEIYFSPKGFSIWQLYSNAKSIEFILRQHHKGFQYGRKISIPYCFYFSEQLWNLFFNMEQLFVLQINLFSLRDFSTRKSIWSSYFPSRFDFSFCGFAKTWKSIWSSYFPSRFNFLFCSFAKTWKSIWSSYLHSKLVLFCQWNRTVANFAQTL